MLTETFVLSTLSDTKASSSNSSRDVGVHLHTYQPLAALQHSFKKSSTAPNCLAATSSHVFAAQAEKAVIHVYNREHGNQEAVVPFAEKVRSIALAGEYEEGTGSLVMGTDGGRILVWELSTGRLVTTPASHLQPVTSLAVAPNHLHAISGSADGQIHLWSIPTLLSFGASTNPAQYTPQHTLSSHRGAITALTFGHNHTKTNIAISASLDNTIIVWDYLSGESLHTFLLSSPAQCLTLDPADRALYAGLNDGSIQIIHLLSKSSVAQTIRDHNAQATPTQPGEKDRWKLPTIDESQGALCLDTSFDGSTLVSGHENGKIYTWNIAKGRFASILHDYTSPVTNMTMLPPTGWPNPKNPTFMLRQVSKPRYESAFSTESSGGTSAGVPLHYVSTGVFASSLPLSPSSVTTESTFQEGLMHPWFPSTWLEEGIAAFDHSRSTPTAHPSPPSSAAPEAVGSTKKSSEVEKLRSENEFLNQQLTEALARSKQAIKENLRHGRERWKQQEEARMKADRKKRRRLRKMKIQENARKRNMGEHVEDDEEMGEGAEEAVEEDPELSSSTDEITDSD